MGVISMTKIKIINEIQKLAINRLTMARKFQLLTWRKEKLQQVLTTIKEERNKRFIKKLWIR